MGFTSCKVCITFYLRPLPAASCGKTRIASLALEDHLTVNSDHGLPRKDKGWCVPPTATPQQSHHHTIFGGIIRDLPS